jgi:hypothetical protein
VQANGVRNDALILGTAWTLMLVGLLCLFKSSPAGPISVLSPAAAGLGWAAILAYALRRERRCSMDRERRAMDAALAAAGGASRAAIDGMAQVLIEQIQGACAELQRGDELLGHAIGQLMAAFNRVSEQAQAHQSELAQAAAAAQGAPAAERLRAAAERVASDVNGAVTALQFRDVVGQKLGHVRSELVALEQAIHRIREVSAQCAHADLASGVGSVLQELRQAKAASPVRQELMHAGEVELF